MIARTLGSALSASLLLVACHDEHATTSAPSAAQTATAGASDPASSVARKLELSSSAFAPGAAMPKKYSCEGDNISPPLTWASAPPGTKSFALIVKDPDAPDPAAPKRVVTHWLVYDLPGNVFNLDEGEKALPAGARQGKNEHGELGFMGPCPPIGRHRYFFKLYALDRTLSDLDGPKVADLEQALRGHVLAAGELIGTYQKGGG
jgi:Raf kinase inhibitor-like YbhB/YbcL family protein